MARKIKRMNWDNFSVKFIQSILYNDKTPHNDKPPFKTDDKALLAPFMDSVFDNYDYFIKKYRSEIEDYFLTEGNHLNNVVNRLSKMHYDGIHLGKTEDMMFNLKQKKLSQAIIDTYRNELLSVGLDGKFDIKTKFPRPRSIDLRNSSSSEENIPLRPYQESAVLAMKKHFLDENKSSGILQMPTGSGKTITSVYFLLTEMLSRGYQIIWLAHRAMLIEQAAENFHKYAPILKDKMENPPERLNMICVSNIHSSGSKINRKDNLIISMVQSLSNFKNKPRIPSILKEKVMIVVDEAHHTLAPTYRDIIETIREQRPESKLLGLSATPIRGNDKDTRKLWKIFESQEPIFSVSMSELINDGTLSKPEPKNIQTNMDIETIIDKKEISYIQQKHEIPDTLVDKIARTNPRNELIVDEYVKNKDKYGKTIIFALNGIHCMALDDAFKARGIKSGFIYTHQPDNDKTIARFKDNNRPDHIDVLININMLTEGSDIPDIQTVFLTRPTQSEALLMQMVGRGMRGIGSGGTETVNIVDFCDKWSDITRWLNPKLIFGDILLPPNVKNTYKPYYYTLYPWDLIRAVMRGITYKGAFVVKNVTVLPLGWFSIVDESGNDEQILVFENQLESYNRLKEDVKYISENLDKADFNAHELLIAYFSGFGLMPTENELHDLIAYYKNEGKFPELQSFEERDQIDPYVVASKIKLKSQTFIDTMNQIESIYNDHKEIIDDLYGGKDYYQRRIVDFMQYPKGIAPLGTTIEEVEKEFYKLDPNDFAEPLEKLLNEVIDEQSENLGADFIKPSINWSPRAYKSYYAQYNHREERKDDFIVVNCVLNSASVPREVLKFLIYHECLHQKLNKHNLEFRELEQKYPNFHEHDNWLDRIFSDFVRDYAM